MTDSNENHVELDAPPARRESAATLDVAPARRTAPATPAQAAVLAASVATLVSACGGGSGDGAPAAGAPAAPSAPAPAPTPPTPTPPAPPTPTPPAPTPTPPVTAYRYPAPDSDAAAARFLAQAQFAASDAEIAALRGSTYASWLNAQFAATPGQTGWDWLNARGYNVVNDATRYYDSSTPADHMIWSQLMTSPDQVRRRIALALSEFFVVSTTGLDFSWRSHAVAAWWDMLCENAFGNFRTLLERVTLSPAMGFYLNTRGNQKENPATGRVPDENYAREVLQLFTIGLTQLNADGTAKRDANGRLLESYSQEDITNLARVFTGYDFDASTGTTNEFVRGSTSTDGTVANPLRVRNAMVVNASRHSLLEKRFLGTTIPAGTDAAASLRAALDTLSAHPNVGPFFARQMIQRLVTSNPAPAYVQRVAAAFDDNGSGVRGDLKAVWRAILLDDAARGPDSLADASWGKLREPMLRFVQWGRTFGVASASGGWRLTDLSNPATLLGQSPLRSPSVFNFFRPGYVPPQSTFATAGATAPEFQLVNESTVAGYLNYMQGAIRNGLLISNGVADVAANYARELQLVNDPAALASRVSLLLAAGQVGTASQAAIRDAVAAVAATTDAGRLNRVAAAVFLTMASPEYLAQK